jgi:hypothetical protein
MSIGNFLQSFGNFGINSPPIEQIVQIVASFPNVVDQYEIEAAIRNLSNTASQYANRK